MPLNLFNIVPLTPFSKIFREQFLIETYYLNTKCLFQQQNKLISITVRYTIYGMAEQVYI